MPAAKKKAPIELQLVEANNRNTFEGKDSVNTSQPHTSPNRTKEEADRLMGESVAAEAQARRDQKKREMLAAEARSQRKQTPEELRARLAQIQGETDSAEGPIPAAHIKVAGVTVMTSVMSGGDLPDEPVVVIRTLEELLTFTPAEACALAAALQAVGVFLMEEEPRIITRRTEPGAPGFEESI